MHAFYFSLLLFWAISFTGSAQIHPLTAKKTSLTPVQQILTAKDSAETVSVLRQRIEALLTDKGLRKSSYGIAISSLDANKPYVEKTPVTPLTPASTTKLLSTFSALYRLGGSYNVGTSIYTDAPEITKGILDGNLYLVGTGDPLLTTGDIEQLADQVYHLGVRTITGGIFADATFFDQITSRAQYSGDNEEVESIGPISALTLNRNIVTVLVTSGATAGTPLRVQTIPSSAAFSFTMNATVGGGGRKGKKRVARGGISIRQTLVSGKQHFTITGSLPPRQTASYGVFTINPPFVAAGVLLDRLAGSGIKVKGSFGIQAAPHDGKLLTGFYRPLIEVISDINKNSDNFAAEHIFKMIGGAAGGKQNTASVSINCIRSALQERNIPFEKCTMNDGCGLSRRNLVAPGSLLRLLTEAARLPFGQSFHATFPIAGVDGTLRKRMRGTSAEGNLSAKTGTLRNASALAGYVTTRDGEHLVFALMFNGNNVSLYKSLENKIGALMADFTFQHTVADAMSE